MEDELVQLESSDADELRVEMADGEAVASKKKGDDEDGIIAVLIG